MVRRDKFIQGTNTGQRITLNIQTYNGDEEEGKEERKV